jgi:hypothetical protein
MLCLNLLLRFMLCGQVFFSPNVNRLRLRVTWHGRLLHEQADLAAFPFQQVKLAVPGFKPPPRPLKGGEQASSSVPTAEANLAGEAGAPALKESERPKIDPTFDELTEGEEIELKEKLKTKWAQLEALVGADNRIALIAKDLITHFES